MLQAFARAPAPQDGGLIATETDSLTVLGANHHKLRGLRGQTFILSQFRRPQVQSQGVSRVTLPLKVPGENPSLLFIASGGSRHSWACGLLSLHLWLPLGLALFSVPVSSSLSLIRTLFIGCRAHLNPR